MIGIATAAFAVAVAAALAQAVTGFGSALVIVPLLTLLVGPQAAVVAATGMSAVLSAYAITRHHRDVAWRPMVNLSVAALLGMPVGLLALVWFSTQTLTLLIGVVLIAIVVVLICGLRLPRRRAAEAIVGFVSGGLLTSTGVNGPPIVAAFEAMRLPPVTFRATLLASLCVQDLVAVAGFGVVGQLNHAALVAIIAGLPGLGVGWLAGDRLFARFRAGHFRWAVLAMMMLSAGMALTQALYF